MKNKIKFLKTIRLIVFISVLIIFLLLLQAIYNRKYDLLEEYEELACKTLSDETSKVSPSEENTIYLEGVKIVLGQTTLGEISESLASQDIDIFEDDFTNLDHFFWYNLNWAKQGYPRNFGIVKIDKGLGYDVKIAFLSNQYLSAREHLDYDKCIIYGVMVPYLNPEDWRLTYYDIDLQKESYESVCDIIGLQEESYDGEIKEYDRDYFRIYIKNNVFYYNTNLKEVDKKIVFWRDNIVDYGYLNDHLFEIDLY